MKFKLKQKTNNVRLMKIPFLLTLILTLPFTSMSFENKDRDLQYFRTPDKTGLNIFEPSKETDVEYDGFDFRIGLSNTMQFQALSQSGPHQNMRNLASNFNLPTSNIDFDAQLADGVRMHLRSWVASQRQGASFHIKGGYIQIDRLDFISDGFADRLMDHLRVKIGHLDFNYGDNHFRRTDNAQAIHNPFVGNYIMDSYTNELGGEAYLFRKPFFVMGGVTNSRMNQTTIGSDDDYDRDYPTFYGKAGYDQQLNENLRVRLSTSLLNSMHTQDIYLYEGDRAGGRYYNVLSGGDRAERFWPDYSDRNWAGEMTSFMFNPFIRYNTGDLGAIEFYGVFEIIQGQYRIVEDDSRTFNHFAGELLYRFGENERFYTGGRYNLVNGEMFDLDDFTTNEIEISRFNIGGGFFMTDNILMKLEYVQQQHQDFPEDDVRHDSEFSGFVTEAIISF